MEPDVTDGSEAGVYDDWRWHTDGAFPAGRSPTQGYVHIGVFVAWLVRHGMADRERIAQLGGAADITGLMDHDGLPTSLRESTGGRLSADLLTAEGRGFTSAYYAPEYGYPRDWQRTFGRRADRYDVPDSWESYDRVAPTIDKRYSEWVQNGRPELMPLPGLLTGLLARWLDRRR
jgi:hypothetical protein